MIKNLKDNTLLIFVSLSIVLLGSIVLSLLTPAPNEKELVEKIIETEVYTTDNYKEIAMWTSIVNRVDQIEIDIKLLKIALDVEEIDEPIVEVIEKQKDGSSTITWPPKIKLNFKSPSNKQ